MYWYEDEVSKIEKEQQVQSDEPHVLFYGSSSIRMWHTLDQDFPAYKVANLGFGGSTLAACTWFLERIMTGRSAKALVVYAGDNDLGDGRHPEEVFIFFQQLMVEAKLRFADIPCFFISLKPSPSRWHIADQFRYTNNLIQNEIIKENGNWKFIDVFSQMLDKSGIPAAALYDTDGLHLSKKGYQLWQKIVSEALVVG